ncbi:MAG: hypothetical protein ACJ8EH_00335 [Sphingomicrobium sp.]
MAKTCDDTHEPRQRVAQHYGKEPVKFTLETAGLGVFTLFRALGFVVAQRQKTISMASYLFDVMNRLVE